MTDLSSAHRSDRLYRKSRLQLKRSAPLHFLIPQFHSAALFSPIKKDCRSKVFEEIDTFIHRGHTKLIKSDASNFPFRINDVLHLLFFIVHSFLGFFFSVKKSVFAPEKYSSDGIIEIVIIFHNFDCIFDPINAEQVIFFSSKTSYQLQTFVFKV